MFLKRETSTYMGKQRNTQNELILSGAVKRNPQRYSGFNFQKGKVIPKDMTLTPPKKVRKETKKAWEAIVPNLISMGALSEQDLPMMGVLFSSYDRMMMLDDKQKSVEQTFDPTDADQVKTLERIDRMRRNAQQEVVQLALRFGLTPTERSRLATGDSFDEEEKDPLDIIMGS